MDERSDRERVQSYRDLRVWKEAMDLAVECYRLTKPFPKEETFGLTSQIRRAASSIPANIAEGYGRDSAGHYVNFLRNAQGSLKELETHVLLAIRVELLREADSESFFSRSEVVGKMLRALIRSIQKSEKPTADLRLPTAEGRDQ
ncbi:MAG TPA: four helix bundle protein [Methylocystis sp.]|nr:four helix bundle protein [Methylocystis sp.]